MKSISSVLKSNMCSGCGLCSASPELMRINESGFARPVLPIEDSISHSACPGMKLVQTNNYEYHELWGPVRSIETGYARDEEIRKLGSSGGVITALLQHCLESNIVDAVIQCGSATQNPIRNEIFEVFDSNELKTNAGSRYAPSSPLALIRSLLGNGKRYAFVGKPCDVAALRTLTNQHAEIQKQFPILLSFMCAGVPSEAATLDILKRLGTTLDKIKSFRYRGNGWPGLTTAVEKSGKTMTMTYNESWGEILNKKLQARCKVCADGTGESADIVCADAWKQSIDGYPSFEEVDGESLIICRTELGRKLLSEATKSKSVTISTDYEIENLKSIQPYQGYRKTTVLARYLALRVMGKGSVKFKGYSILMLALKDSPVSQLKAFLGALLRIIRNKF